MAQHSTKRLRRLVSSVAVVLAFIGLNACAKAPLPVAQFQLIDADTMKPIEGGWVNFVWYGKKLTGKVQSRPCVRAVLGRSDQNGWVRDTARESFWVLDPIANYFVPGYEYFQYSYGEPDEQHITTTIRQDRFQKGQFPAWEKKLEELGYVWKPNEWQKVMSASGFMDRRKNGSDHRIYLVPYRSIPTEAQGSFQMVGMGCNKPGSENVGLDKSSLAQAWQSRAAESLKYICGAEWHSIPADYQFTYAGWIQRSLWLLPDQGKTFEEMQRRFPDFTKQPYWSDPMASQRPFTAEEQAQFCGWLMPLANKEISHAKN
jgi:hypothetical protein